MVDGIKNITIIGAGIAGLTAALAIVKRAKETNQCINLQIFEAAKSLNEEGAGLQLSPNATHILRKLGVLDQLIECAGIPNDIKTYDGRSGKALANIPLGDYAKNRYGAPYIVVHRADLHHILLTEVEKHSEIILKFGHKLTDIVSLDVGYQFIFKNNDKNITHKADLYIAADGVWSKTKTLLLIDLNNPSEFSGHIAWRSIIDAKQLDKKYLTSTSVWFGAKAHIVLYPIRNNQKFNLVILTEGEFKQKSWALSADIKQLKQHLTGWCSDVNDILNAATDVKIWPLCAGKPEYQTAENNILLIGDAAHATLPYQAQGAAMAIEDAACLANLLYSNSSNWQDWSAAEVNENFRSFEAMRQQRVVKTQLAAQENAKIFHMVAPLSWARNIFLFLATKFYRNGLLSRLDWLYSKRYDNF
ncbi:MAG: FAD-dependent monooxygenase [Rhizobiales bacterium]|nr:FAD-dependent monooxygenase [Hyphomicrobiales bacterium]